MDFVKEAIRQNPHWETGEFPLPRMTCPFVKRGIWNALLASSKKKFITVLKGLRRTGKSVLARQLVREALGKGAAPKDFGWFEFDRAMNATPDDLDALLQFFENRGARTVILDEIPFVPKWQDILKRHYDRTDVKFVVTGSSALELDRRTSESLAGRFEALRVEPFSLPERLEQMGRLYKGTALEDARRSDELVVECDEYVRTGGLPEIACERAEAARAKYVNESLLDPLLYKDLPVLFSNANPDMLRKTLELLAATAGSVYQLQTIAQVLGCTHPTAGTQVELLERAMLVRTLFNKTSSLVKQRRTAKRIVFADNGILRALRPEAPVGCLAENAAANVLGPSLFWRDSEGHEVDIVIPEEKIAIEVKYQEHITAADEKNLRYFLGKNSGWRGLLVTKREEDRGAELPRLPLWKLLARERDILKSF